MALPILYGGLAGLQLAGSYFAAQNVKETAELNREIANMNAEFAELDAYDAEIEGLSESARYQSVIDETIDTQRVLLEAQGVDTSFGSAAALQEESKFIGTLNKMEIEARAQERALGFERQADDIRLSSHLQFAKAEQRASDIMFQGVTSAAQTGLTGYARSR